MKVVINQAVILAGGRGERLKPITDEIPKPMAPINDVPFLDYLIYSVVEAGIKKVLLLLGYKANKIIERYSNLKSLELQIDFSIGDVEEQTGRRVLNAYDQLDSRFLLMYGDNYWPIQLKSMLEFWRKSGATVTTTVFDNKYGSGEYGFENNVFFNKKFLVEYYDKSRKKTNLNGVDMGYFLVEKNILDRSIKGNISFEEYFLPLLIEQRKLYAYVTDLQYYYLTNIDTLKAFEKYAIAKNIKFLKVGR